VLTLNRREILSKLGDWFIKLLETLSNEKIIVTIVLLISFLIALLLRLAPMRWGIYLNEFDPFYEYYLAEQIIKHSKNSILDGIAWWFSWWFDSKTKDTLFWAPIGRDVRATSQPGAAIFSSTIYWILSSIGFKVDLYTVHAFLPPIGASLAVFAIYLLGKEVRGIEVGLLSAILLSVCEAFLSRTNFGAKHEGLAIPFMILFFYLFLRSYRAKSKALAFLAGISMGFVVLSWGAYLYPWNLVALSALIWLIYKPSDYKMAETFIISNLIAQLFIAITPRFGPRTAFLSAYSIVPMTANIASLVVLLGRKAPLPRVSLRTAVTYLLVITGVGLAVLWYLGLLQSFSGRVLAVIIPVWRVTGVTTVAEHAVPSWASFFSDYSSSMIFAILGGLLALRDARRDFKHMFISLFLFTSLYFAGSMVRLTLLLSPAVALLSAYAFVELTTGIIEVLIRKPSKYKLLRRQEVSKDAMALVLIVIFLLMGVSIVNAKVALISHTPPLILTSSVSSTYNFNYDYRFSDWLSALEWIKENVPENTIIATWWDYGYWISVNTRRNTTCDNATIYRKQIQKVAEAFLSSEDRAIEIFKELGASYVVIFEPFQYLTYAGTKIYYPGYQGDFSKSAQMAVWIHRNPRNYITSAIIESGGQRLPIYVPANTTEALNSTLYRMMFTKTQDRQLFVFEPLLGQRLPFYNGPTYTFKPLEHFRLVYASEPNEWVLIFKIIYD